MGKANKRKNKGGSSSSGGGGGKNNSDAPAVWDGSDHVLRKERQLDKKSKKLDQTDDLKEHARVERRFHRTAKLTRDSQEKREQAKLRLNITKTQRDVEKLRKRLQQWDQVEEKAWLVKQQEEEERKAREEEEGPPKKRGRLGPESWKLKGAARPAWQVCEFDVRYECPHQKAHEEARVKARRVKNLLVLYKGSFGHDHKNDQLSYPHRRQFLALLMQWGLLCMESKKYKTARLAFLECLDLDGVQEPITDARCHLMRLYLQVNRPQSVYQLWKTKLSPEHESSPWVLFSVALVEYIRWKNFEESTRLEAESALALAVKGNVLCAFYLAFANFFHQHMEYTDEVEDMDEDDKSPLEEAIEYCSSEQMGMWMGTDGALEWVKNTLLRVLHGQTVANGALSLLDLEWSAKLQQVEEEKKENDVVSMSTDENKETPQGSASSEEHSNDDNSLDGEDSGGDEEEDEASSRVNTMMYVGMFRTTMEMLYESGALSTPPPMIVEEDQLAEEKQTKVTNEEEEGKEQANKNANNSDSASESDGSSS